MTVPGSPLATGGQEREMTRHQRGLVDTCFEEGQYESGISVLEQLRSSQFKPSESHIRQLLYIALYPPLPPPAADDERKERGKDTFDSSIPSKAAAKQVQKSPLIPSMKATEAALRLLTSFTLTNSPGALGRALPENVSGSDWLAKVRKNDEDMEEDSYIAREAMCIHEAKHVWAILKDGMIQRKVVAPMTPKGKGKKRRRDYEHHSEDKPSDAEGVAPQAIVSDNAWPVLDWLLAVFEKDELLVEESGSLRYSPILLSQIPPPRSGAGARWEADAPLNIVFHCLEQTLPKRRAMGTRLMTLLINLSSTIHFDLNLFVTSVYTRLSSTSSATSTDTFSTLFSALTPSPVISKFKLALCKKYLTSLTTTSSSVDGPQPTFRPRPQARAIHSSRQSGVPQHESSMSSVKSTTSDSTSATSITSKYPLPPLSEILYFLQQPLGGSYPLTQSLRIKFELLLSYALVQNPTTEVRDQESEWQNMLLDGRVQEAVDSAFAGEGGGRYKESLKMIMGT